MLRGYRLVVIALVGFLTCYGNVGLAYAQVSRIPITEQGAPDQNSAQYSSSRTGQLPSASQNQERCEDTSADNGPDICAQWVAAIAARQSAVFARQTLYWTIGGFFAILLTLIATGIAAWAAAKAAAVVSGAERAYLVFSHPQSAVRLGEDLIAVDIVVCNLGRTMANIYAFRMRYTELPPYEWETVSTGYAKPRAIELGQNQTYSEGLQIRCNMAEPVYVSAVVKYRDVMQRQHETVMWVRVHPDTLRVEPAGNEQHNYLT